jgi:uncharacterized protein YjiS (DUF1127 family)
MKATHLRYLDTCRRSGPDALRHLARRVATILGLWRRRQRDRRELVRLAELDDRMLADIGLSRSDAEFLINKPFWRE